MFPVHPIASIAPLLSGSLTTPDREPVGEFLAGTKCQILSTRARTYEKRLLNTACSMSALPFPKVISGLRRPIAIQAAISFNMNLPE